MKIYRYSMDYPDVFVRGKISHITFRLGKHWISFDRSGIMGWNDFKKKNFFFIFSERRGRAF